MGDPRKSHKKYNRPDKPWDKDRIHKELGIVGKYGLRNKREVWRIQTELSSMRGRARKLLSLVENPDEIGTAEIIKKLFNIGVLPQNASLDDVLDLQVEDILERRLQTIVYNQGLANTIYHARQLIVHGHIALRGEKVNIPSYIVKRGEETDINYAPSSPINDPEHVARPNI